MNGRTCRISRPSAPFWPRGRNYQAYFTDAGGITPGNSVNVSGIQVGKVYPFDMFQAERHTTESNFRADTNLEFVDCGTIVPDVPK